jgi:hypothetical protein
MEEKKYCMDCVYYRFGDDVKCGNRLHEHFITPAPSPTNCEDYSNIKFKPENYEMKTPPLNEKNMLS